MRVLSLEPGRNVRQGKDARRGEPPLGDGPNGRSHHGMDVFMCVDNDNVDDTSTVKVQGKEAVRGRAQRTVTPRYGVFFSDNDDDEDDDDEERRRRHVKSRREKKRRRKASSRTGRRRRRRRQK